MHHWKIFYFFKVHIMPMDKFIHLHTAMLSAQNFLGSHVYQIFIQKKQM